MDLGELLALQASFLINFQGDVNHFLLWVHELCIAFHTMLSHVIINTSRTVLNHSRLSFFLHRWIISSTPSKDFVLPCSNLNCSRLSWACRQRWPCSWKLSTSWGYWGPSGSWGATVLTVIDASCQGSAECFQGSAHQFAGLSPDIQRVDACVTSLIKIPEKSLLSVTDTGSCIRSSQS